MKAEVMETDRQAAHATRRALFKLSLAGALGARHFSYRGLPPV